MKKVLTLLLALTMCIGLMIPAAAGTTETITGMVMDSSVSVSVSNVIAKETVTITANIMEIGASEPCDEKIEKTVVLYQVPVSGATLTVTVNSGTFGAYPGIDGYFWMVNGVYCYMETGEQAGDAEIDRPFVWDLSFDEQDVQERLVQGWYICKDLIVYVTCADLDDILAFAKTESEPEAFVSPFTDVPDGAYYADAVKWAYENNVTTGTSATTFGPMDTCTRGQVMTFLWRANGCPEPTSTVNPFTDVKETDYFYKAVLWAVENGITNGTSATTFGPKDTCTSAHVVTFLWRSNGQPAAVGESALVESGKWYSDAVAWADTTGLLQGTDTAFAAGNNSLRADIVTYLYRDAVK